MERVSETDRESEGERVRDTEKEGRRDSEADGARERQGDRKGGSQLLPQTPEL